MRVGCGGGVDAGGGEEGAEEGARSRGEGARRREEGRGGARRGWGGRWGGARSYKKKRVTNQIFTLFWGGRWGGLRRALRRGEEAREGGEEARGGSEEARGEGEEALRRKHFLFDKSCRSTCTIYPIIFFYNCIKKKIIIKNKVCQVSVLKVSFSIT